MHISAKGNYGIWALLDLAQRHGQGYVQTAEIAERQQIPESYLVQLLNQLRKAGLVRSVRGPKGGHALLKQPEEITVGDILDVLEGPVDLLGKSEGRSEDLRQSDVLREVWDDVRAAIEGVLQSVTLGDLCRRVEKQEQRIVYRI
jgi:Rrf2 family transcriptional regulator, cysteine metabolism repressor